MSIYFDNAATTFPKPEEVYDAVDDYLRTVGVNPGRGGYRRSLEAEKLIFRTRKLLGQLFNIGDISRIIFTGNVTESLNLAFKGLLATGDHVIISELEHNAVWRPLRRLERERGIDLTVIPCPGGKEIDLNALKEAVRSETRLVAVTHASNVTGAIMPLEKLGKFCRNRGIVFLVDSAQTAGVFPLDVERQNISLLGFTGHKGLMGPTGTGGLYIEEGLNLLPLKEGGTGSQSQLDHQPEDLPDRFEAGTLNTAGIVGLGAAVDFVLQQGVDQIRAHERELVGYLHEKIKDIPGITIYGPERAAERVAVISFNIGETPPEEIAYVLDRVYEIMVRAGLHCSPLAHRCLGTEERGALRVSPGFFNTPEEIDELAGALRDIAKN